MDLFVNKVKKFTDDPPSDYPDVINRKRFGLKLISEISCSGLPQKSLLRFADEFRPEIEKLLNTEE